MKTVSDEQDWPVAMAAPGQVLTRCSGKRIVPVGHPCPHCGGVDLKACQWLNPPPAPVAPPVAQVSRRRKTAP